MPWGSESLSTHSLDVLSNWLARESVKLLPPGRVGSSPIGPDRDVLASMLVNNTYVSMATQIGVSNTTIKKWCIQYGLDIKSHCNNACSK